MNLYGHGKEIKPPDFRSEKDIKYIQNLEYRVLVLESALKAILPHVNETSPIEKIIKQALEVKP